VVVEVEYMSLTLQEQVELEVVELEEHLIKTCLAQQEQQTQVVVEVVQVQQVVVHLLQVEQVVQVS
jgi:hypothetical protein